MTGSGERRTYKPSFARNSEEADLKTIDLSIVIPVYNSRDTLFPLVERLVASCTGKISFEIVLVNDYSWDDSWNVVERLYETHPDLVVGLCFSNNFGEHNAVMAGYREARGDYIINIDDDFQNPPEEILRMLETIRDRYDIVYGYYEEKKDGMFRNLGSTFNGKMAEFVLDKPRDLYLSSFRIITRNLAKQVVSYNGPYPYIDGLILRATRDIGTLLVQHNQRKAGQSNYTLRKLMRLWSYMFLNFSIKPLRLSIILGFLFAVLGFAMALLVVLERFLLSGIPRGWASIMTAILVLSGTQLITLGVLGEYLGRVFLTLNNSPQYVVKKKIGAS